MILLAGLLANCGPRIEEAERAPAQPTYVDAFGVERLVFNGDASGVQGATAGGETIALLDCSDELVVCRTVPGGPVFIAIARDIQNVDNWRAEGRGYVVRARSPSVGAAEIVFVEVAAPSDPTWKEAFAYEIGVGVTSMTLNYDANTRLSETLLLSGGEGILRTLDQR